MDFGRGALQPAKKRKKKKSGPSGGDLPPSTIVAPGSAASSTVAGAVARTMAATFAIIWFIALKVLKMRHRLSELILGGFFLWGALMLWIATGMWSNKFDQVLPGDDDIVDYKSTCYGGCGLMVGVLRPRRAPSPLGRRSLRRCNPQPNKSSKKLQRYRCIRR